jgi:hypothetical protein
MKVLITMMTIYTVAPADEEMVKHLMETGDKQSVYDLIGDALAGIDTKEFNTPSVTISVCG